MEPTNINQHPRSANCNGSVDTAAVCTAGNEFIYTIGIETYDPNDTREDAAEDSKVAASQGTLPALTHSFLLHLCFSVGDNRDYSSLEECGIVDIKKEQNRPLLCLNSTGVLDQLSEVPHLYKAFKPV